MNHLQTTLRPSSKNDQYALDQNLEANLSKKDLQNSLSKEKVKVSLNKTIEFSTKGKIGMQN